MNRTAMLTASAANWSRPWDKQAGYVTAFPLLMGDWRRSMLERCAWLDRFWLIMLVLPILLLRYRDWAAVRSAYSVRTNSRRNICLKLRRATISQRSHSPSPTQVSMWEPLRQQRVRKGVSSTSMAAKTWYLNGGTPAFLSSLHWRGRL